MIDTLILSGGGPSGMAYVGIFRGLFERDIIQRNEIKEVISTSVGMIFAILYLLDFSVDQMEKIILETEFEDIFNMNELEIDNLLVNYGLFNNKMIGEWINILCKHKLGRENITLRELYDIIPVKFTVKVYNVTLGKSEYMSYENEPDLHISKLVMITTAIPFLFQPILLKGNLYIDGGIKGHFPIEGCHSENYLGIILESATCNPESFQVVEMFPIFGYIISLMSDKDNNLEKYDTDKIMKVPINLGFNFSFTKDKKKDVIKTGYDKCIEFIT